MKEKGEAGFQKFYETHWATRWPDLMAALLGPVQKVSVENPFVTTVPELRAAYELDPASVLVAQTLRVQAHEKVLDMCAAPGGKSLIKIFELKGKAHWVLNDISPDRVQRLRRVINEHVPDNIKTNIKITKHDATRWGLFEPQTYDRILLDAPCSGERHLLQNKTELAHWSQKRSTGLKQRQYALLCAAAQAIKPGGQIVYSTCSLSPLENDEVIERFLDRKPDQLVVETLNLPTGERTRHGWIILPDRFPGQGPMFISSLIRKSD